MEATARNGSQDVTSRVTLSGLARAIERIAGALARADDSMPDPNGPPPLPHSSIGRWGVAGVDPDRSHYPHDRENPQHNTVGSLRSTTGTRHSNMDGILRWVRQLLSRIEASRVRSGWRPEQLTPASRRQLAWLHFLGTDGNLADYLRAVRSARALFTEVAPLARWRRPLSIHFLPTQSLYRMRTTDDGTRILLPTPMIVFDARGFSELARVMFGRRRHGRDAVLHDLMLGPSYQAVQSQLEGLGGGGNDTRGRIHDLADSFARVNAACFNGQMPPPRLMWSRRVSTLRFGYYRYANDTVTISQVLDHPDIPTFVIDHVMHHELLHKKHGLRWQNGRGHAHTREFRAEERSYERFHEADQFLRRLARKR